MKSELEFIIFLIFILVIFFPSIGGSLAINEFDTDARHTTIETAENDSKSVMDIDEKDSIQIGESEQDLVNITNNMKTQKETDIDLQNDISWHVSESEKVERTLSPNQSTTYTVDTTDVDSSVSRGKYVLRMRSASFLISAEREVIFEEQDILSSDTTVLYEGLNALSENGTDEQTLGPDNVNAIGPIGNDIDGDGSSEVPFVNSSGSLRITDSDGNNKTLIENKPEPEKDKTLMSVGTWNGSSQSVFFAGNGGNRIYRVDYDGTTEVVSSPDNGAQAVSGFGDIDDDGGKELVYIDSSQQLRYIEGNGTTRKISDGGLGSSTGIGAGPPPDLDEDGTPRILGVSGSNNIKIVGVAEPDLLITKVTAAKSPITAADIDSDGDQEILYINKDNDYIKFVDNPLNDPTVKTVEDSNGDPIVGDQSLGVISG